MFFCFLLSSIGLEPLKSLHLCCILDYKCFFGLLFSYCVYLAGAGVGIVVVVVVGFWYGGTKETCNPKFGRSLGRAQPAVYPKFGPNAQNPADARTEC